jgi:hypothetical protein
VGVSPSSSASSAGKPSSSGAPSTTQ